jgi:hypothetical protein
MASKSPKASKSISTEWPSASVGSDALESIRDGNPPHALVAFARKAIGANNHAWAIEYLRRGLDYLRYVTTSFPDVADSVKPHIRTVTNVLVDAAVAIDDQATLTFSLPAAPTPSHFASFGWKLLDAKHLDSSRQWFARARTLPMDEAERLEHLLRFGVAELTAQKNAGQIDSAFASEVVAIARVAITQMDAAHEQTTYLRGEMDQLLSAAEKALGETKIESEVSR